MTREISAKELCHERLGEDFARALSRYDTTRRVEVLVEDFLAGKTAGARALDVGCGLGFFSEALVKAGARVTACDLGANLVETTRQRVGCEARVADALALEDTFGRDSFDVVVSSECIEHTPDPRRALRSMSAVLRPGGWLSVSTPNRLWYPVVRAATVLRLRPFDGFENFSTWSGLRETLESSGLRVEREYGLHLYPFQLRLSGLSRWCDRNLQVLRGCMINLCVLARKDARP